MKFLIISDTHGNFNSFNEAVMRHPQIDDIFFLGDGYRDFEDICDLYPNKKYYSVSGNCDFMCMRPSWDTLLTSQGKILYTHGDAFGVKNGLGKLLLEAKKQNAIAAFFGHTHIPFYEEREGIVLFNPGSLGKGGTYGVGEIANGKIKLEHLSL